MLPTEWYYFLFLKNMKRGRPSWRVQGGAGGDVGDGTDPDGILEESPTKTSSQWHRGSRSMTAPSAPSATPLITRVSASSAPGISSAVFYSGWSISQHKVHVANTRKVEERERECKRGRSADPESIPSFPRQIMATEYIQVQENLSSTDDCLLPQDHKLRLFAKEYSASGSRSFLVASARNFWRHYIRISPGQRHCYEIIRERIPCRLYFDLEFQIASNPELAKRTEEILHTFIHAVAARACASLGTFLGPSSFLQLNSSTPTKFSVHLVVQDVIFR